MSYEIFNCDCIDAMQLCIEDNSVDAIITDPPYGLSFMGKKWDYDVPSVEMWREAFRVLKPGGHVLAFAGTRTQHRMACAIEDAGFEIRDLIAWVYGSGFPKSLDVSKAIDKHLGAVREKVPPKSVISHQRNLGNRRPYMDDPNHVTDSDVPASTAAAAWQGWGTALKPALEPITVARKPLVGTVAENVQAFGVGALNIEGCRVEGGRGADQVNGAAVTSNAYGKIDREGGKVYSAELGRWPANLVHDGSEEVLASFPQAPGQVAKASSSETRKNQNMYGEMKRGSQAGAPREDSGSAARFFYCAKASRSDRGEGNTHPTVKPIALMRYLCRLITPPGGLILDPFSGSGSTGVAAMLEGFRFTGCELEAQYVAIAERRIRVAMELSKCSTGAA